MVKNLPPTIIFIVFLLSLPNIGVSAGSYFIRNQGQWSNDILFRADLPGGFLFLKDKSMVYVLYDVGQVASHHTKSPLKKPAGSDLKAAPDLKNISAHGVEVFFENSNSSIRHIPKRQTDTKFNFFLGSDSAKWVGGVGGFEEVLYENVYKDIDLRIYIYQSTLKYEFIVHPNADASQIALKYQGANELSLNKEGQVSISTSVGVFKEAKPYSYQVVDKRTIEVPSQFILSEGNRMIFALPKGYLKAQTLTIDPELIFSTYSGSTSDNWGHTATYDAQGNLYSGGTVFGKDFPATVGAFQTKFAGEVDVSILKFSPDGSKLLYATFLGGASTDIPSSLIVNAKDELLIYGTTSSRNFPIKEGAFQPVFGGGVTIVPISGLDLPNGSDIFLAKLNSGGSQLLASTYFGGEGNDGLSTEENVGINNYGDSFRGEIGLDLSGNVVVASSTNSKQFPLRNPAKSKLTGRQDGVLFRMSDTFTNLLWSTYVGGDGYDAAFSVKVAKTGDVYIAGITQSTDLPTHATSHQPKINGTEDAFVTRFSSDKLVGTSYLGTSLADGAYLLDLDQAGNVYVYGLSKGKYPVTTGVYSNANSGQFIHKLDQTLSQSLFSTVIGSGRGAPDISPTAFLVSECGNIYIAGWGGAVNVFNGNNLVSSTVGLPVTKDAIQPGTNGSNFYIAILEEGAKSLLYATYFGNQDRTGTAQGDHVDGGTSRFDKNGMIYHATCSCGGSFFPVTPQAWSSTNNSANCNNAAFKIDIDRLAANFDVFEGTKKDVTRGCAPLSLSFINTSEGGVDYLWQVNGNTISREEEKAAYVFNTPGEYTVVLKAYNRLSCKREDVAQKKIIVETLDVLVKGDTAVCENTAIKLWASGGTQYKWSPAAGLDNAQIASPTVNVKQSTDYTVEISNISGCKVIKTVKVLVEKKNDFTILPDLEICAGAATVLTVSGGAKEYHWLPNPTLPATTGNSVIVKPTVTTTYVVEGIYEDGCRPVRQVTVNVDRSFEPSFDISKKEAACNELAKYSLVSKSGNAQRYEWYMGAGDVITSKDVTDFSFDKEGEYTMTLTNYNAAGCALSTSKTLVAEPPFILANVITPNGDGKNDFFVVPVPNSRFQVFNRWGKSVFLSEEYKNEWGKKVPNGTYYFTVDTPAGNHCKGWVEVLE
jgi:gliding motility-associated-like protein